MGYVYRRPPFPRLRDRLRRAAATRTVTAAAPGVSMVPRRLSARYVPAAPIRLVDNRRRRFIAVVHFAPTPLQWRRRPSIYYPAPRPQRLDVRRRRFIAAIHFAAAPPTIQRRRIAYPPLARIQLVDNRRRRFVATLSLTPAAPGTQSPTIAATRRFRTQRVLACHDAYRPQFGVRVRRRGWMSFEEPAAPGAYTPIVRRRRHQQHDYLPPPRAHFFTRRRLGGGVLSSRFPGAPAGRARRVPFEAFYDKGEITIRHILADRGRRIGWMSFAESPVAGVTAFVPRRRRWHPVHFKTHRPQQRRLVAIGFVVPVYHQFPRKRRPIQTLRKPYFDYAALSRRRRFGWMSLSLSVVGVTAFVLRRRQRPQVKTTIRQRIRRGGWMSIAAPIQPPRVGLRRVTVRAGSGNRRVMVRAGSALRRR